MNRQSSFANLAYALPFICIPFGILLICLSLQQEKWPFVLAGIVLSISGCLGGMLFRSILGLVLTLCGIVLAVIPYSDKTPWACIFIGSILAIMGSIGLMALALRRNLVLRSARILVVLLPIAIVFFCVPLQNLEYPAVMICIGVVLIVAGILGGIEAAVRPSRQFAKCADDLRVVVEQLNQRYANRIVWTLIERANESRRRFGKTLEIVVEVDEKSPYNQGLVDSHSPGQQQQGQQPIINIVLNNDPSSGASRNATHPADVAVAIPQS